MDAPTGGADASTATYGMDTAGGVPRPWVLTEGFNEIARGGRPDKDGMEGRAPT